MNPFQRCKNESVIQAYTDLCETVMYVLSSPHRMTYEKLKTDVMRWKEEHRAITESRPQKDWKLSSLQHELEQMKSTRDSYQAEVGTDLLSQLSVNEQGEVDRLNDKIQDLTRRAKEAYRRRMRLESEKSQLETQLYHNLFRKREQLERDLNEVSETDLNEKFRDAEEELTSVEQRIKDFQVSVCCPLLFTWSSTASKPKLI